MIYLDSAHERDALAAADLGFVSGITTNPTLMAQTGRPAVEQVETLLRVFPGKVFHQAQPTDLQAGLVEAQQVLALDPERVVIKLPATLDHFRLGARLVDAGTAVAMTAVYSAGQAVLAAEIGAGWVICYVDRARRLLGDDGDLPGDLATVLGRTAGHRPQVLAASLKTPDQVTHALLHGADDVTLSLALIEQLAEHPLSHRAMDEFAAEAATGTAASSRHDRM